MPLCEADQERPLALRILEAVLKIAKRSPVSLHSNAVLLMRCKERPHELESTLVSGARTNFPPSFVTR